MKDVAKVSRRSGDYRPDWLSTYKSDLKLLGARCERCGSTKNLDRHHILHKQRHGGSDAPINLMILCKPCHKEKHKR